MEILLKYYRILIILIIIIALALFLKNRSEEDNEDNDFNFPNYKRKSYFFSYHELELYKLLRVILQSQY
jgi:uncharacterized membrane protein YadS